MERGGWVRPLFDDEALASDNELYQLADAFLFGRRTTRSLLATGA
jgi:hypothetical protein